MWWCACFAPSSTSATAARPPRSPCAGPLSFTKPIVCASCEAFQETEGDHGDGAGSCTVHHLREKAPVLFAYLQSFVPAGSKPHLEIVQGFVQGDRHLFMPVSGERLTLARARNSAGGSGYTTLPQAGRGSAFWNSLSTGPDSIVSSNDAGLYSPSPASTLFTMGRVGWGQESPGTRKKI